jgi:hypothetical protein
MMKQISHCHTGAEPDINTATEMPKRYNYFHKDDETDMHCKC